jgi:hypothetical protein
MWKGKMKFPLNPLEVVCLVILIPMSCLSSFILLYGKEYNLPWRMISSKIAVATVLGLNAVWLVLSILLPSKYRRIKVVLTFLLIALSCVVLTDLRLIHSWSRMW